MAAQRPRGRPPNLKLRQRAAELYQQGFSTLEIGRELGLSYQYVERKLLAGHLETVALEVCCCRCGPSSSKSATWQRRTTKTCSA